MCIKICFELLQLLKAVEKLGSVLYKACAVDRVNNFWQVNYF